MEKYGIYFDNAIISLIDLFSCLRSIIELTSIIHVLRACTPKGHLNKIICMSLNHKNKNS